MLDVILDTNHWITLKENSVTLADFKQTKQKHQFNVLFTRPNFVDLAKRPTQDKLSGIISDITDTYVAVEDYKDDEYLHSDNPLLLLPPKHRDELKEYTIDFGPAKTLKFLFRIMDQDPDEKFPDLSHALRDIHDEGGESYLKMAAFWRYVEQDDDWARVELSDATFSVAWHTLLDELDDLPEDATLITPLSHNRFQISDIQEQRVIIEFLDRDIDETRPLQREQFETLYRRIADEPDGFELDRLPPDADPYPTVLSMHPRFEIDEERGVIVEKEEATTSQLLDAGGETGTRTGERTKPELDVYADALLLVDALERHEVEVLEDMETDALVNLYTLLSDVQRNANDLRQDVADVLLTRLHHDRPVSGPFGSVQRTTRRNRSLKDEDEVLATLEDAGIDSERVMGVDRDKVDDALDVTELSESDVYEIEESEYVRKAEVDEERKETRLQGLKDQLAAADGDEAEELREEIEALESRIEELTEFKSGASFHTRAGGEP